ncbi:MAG: CDP-diacylglycerol--glycerol-3-phosphate 3-phosphatidyltransferase [Planctomycetes bacterium]|nr:CDP-diacylglycerol--glycerol-3-phosphate 3-phosphatidyltransferase [Planctomycetota bacterium]
MNLPNKITLGRLLVSAIYFLLLSLVDISAGAAASALPANQLLLNGAIVLFLVAALTDMLDGYLARKYGMVTDFGRVMDPFVDKILVCGSMAYLLTFPEIARYQPAWMVALVLGREFLISGIRGVAEGRGIAFGAKPGGKLKMTVQCTAIATSLFFYTHFQDQLWCRWLTAGLFWASLGITVGSALPYLRDARAIFRQDLGAAEPPGALTQVGGGVETRR